MAKRGRLKRIATAPFRGAKALTGMIFGRNGFQFGRFMRLPGTQFPYERRAGNGMHNSIVVACVRWLQRSVPQAPIRMREPDPDTGILTPVADHPLVNLLNHPNPAYTWTVLLKATIASYTTDGNAYWVIIRNGSLSPVELWWTPETLITPMHVEGSEQLVDFFEYRVNGMTIRLLPEDVVHFRDGIDPDNQLKGQSPLKSLVREIYTDDEAANFTASLLRNMGVPGLIISPREGGSVPPPDGQADATKRKIKTLTTGDKRGEPVVMSGPTDIETVGFNPEQMNLKAIRRIPEERITAGCGVPAIVAGMGAGLDRSTFANMGEAREMAWENGAIPMQKDFADVINFRLLPEFESLPTTRIIDFDTTDIRVLQEDSAKLAARMVSVVTGGIATVAEGRSPLGLEINASHDIFLRPINLIETPNIEGNEPISDDDPDGDDDAEGD